jgi:hypothetical protein
VGGLAQGALADAFGPRATVLGAGIVLLALAGVLSSWRGRLRMQRLDDPHDDLLPSMGRS